MSETIMERKLKEAIEKKQQDITNFVWKGSKSLDENGKYRQNEKRLVDMTERELQNAYDHCKTMLFNKDSENPGRYVVLESIADQRDKIGAELFLRYVEQNHHLVRFTLLTSINEFLRNNKDVSKTHKLTVSDAIPSAPNEFEKVPINMVVDGCLDRLGTFNKKHITRTFVLKQGIWLTPAESKELLEHNPDGSVKDRLEVVRERLNIKEVEKLFINSKGLNYTQMRAMLNIKPNRKYLDLTTTQLETLRYRILFNLEESVKNHISSWERRMEEIELVLTSKGYQI